MAKSKRVPVQVNLPEGLPAGITPTLHVFDTHGAHVGSAKIAKSGAANVPVPAKLEGAALRYVVAPTNDEAPTLKQLRRVQSVESLHAFDPQRELVLDIGDRVIGDWLLCWCTVRGSVVKAVEQPTGSSVDYPVCSAKVHVCEVDRIPRIIWRIPDYLIYRVREELLVDPPPPDPIGPVIRREPFDRVPVERIDSVRNRFAPRAAPAADSSAQIVRAESFAADVGVSDLLARAADAAAVRAILVDIAVLYPWWCWFEWLDPYFNYEVDCNWEVMTDAAGEFEVGFSYSCNDTPDIYIWVEQCISGTWQTIYAKGPRCDTHWDYDCGSEITIRVTHPDAIVCIPPPEIEVPPGVTTWVLPMAVGHLEIAGASSHALDPLGWVQTDGTASYNAGAPNVAPIMDAPLGGLLRFKMLHSLDLPTAAMPRYLWSYRSTPAVPTSPGGWIGMDLDVFRKYQVPGPSGPPVFPAYPLGPDAGGLFEFRPHTPPAGTWPLTGFWEDLWSAKLNTIPLPTGDYQVRVTVHDAAGNVVSPGTGTFEFVVTDERDAAKETYSTRLATGGEIIEDGFVFDVQVDNAPTVAALHPVQTSDGGVADSCGFLRYADKSATNVTLDFEASHPNDRAWFILDLVRGLNDLNQCEVGDGGLVGALSVPVDSNGGGVWPSAFYTGDGAGNFSGTFTAARFLQACDNAAFAADLYTRAKAHNGIERIHGYDRHSLMAFALAEEEGS